MVAHQQKGFYCIYAKQPISHESQTAGQVAKKVQFSQDLKFLNIHEIS